MKNKMYVAAITGLVVSAGGLIWFETHRQNPSLNIANSGAPIASYANSTPVQSPLVNPSIQQPANASAPTAPVVTDQPKVVEHVADTIASDGVIRHVAQPGETVSSLASNLLGKDSRTNGDAIINANTSLQADPDRLLAGKAYHVPSSVAVTEPSTSTAVSSDKSEPVTKAPAPEVTPTELRYTAAPGDTVGKLAAAFLGSDTQANQDVIIAANPSLKTDPDHLLAGKTYRIPAPDGLSASTTQTAKRTIANPATQPDTDQIIAKSAPRMLRYTAKSGDTVTTLAIELLGSDTQTARNTIIFNNPSLKRDPDRLIAGQTYSIPAPAAETTNP